MQKNRESNKMHITQHELSHLLKSARRLEKAAVVAMSLILSIRSPIVSGATKARWEPPKPIQYITQGEIKRNGKIFTINGQMFERYAKSATLHNGTTRAPFKGVRTVNGTRAMYSTGTVMPDYKGKGYYKFHVIGMERNGRIVRATLRSEKELDVVDYYKDLHALYGVNLNPPKMIMSKPFAINGWYFMSNGGVLMQGDGSKEYPFIYGVNLLTVKPSHKPKWCAWRGPGYYKNMLWETGIPVQNKEELKNYLSDKGPQGPPPAGSPESVTASKAHPEK